MDRSTASSSFPIRSASVGSQHKPRLPSLYQAQQLPWQHRWRRRRSIATSGVLHCSSDNAPLQPRRPSGVLHCSSGDAILQPRPSGDASLQPRWSSNGPKSSPMQLRRRRLAASAGCIAVLWPWMRCSALEHRWSSTSAAHRRRYRRASASPVRVASHPQGCNTAAVACGLHRLSICGGMQERGGAVAPFFAAPWPKYAMGALLFSRAEMGKRKK